MDIHQHTIRKQYSFRGKGLHTGRTVNLTLEPAEAGSGIRFRRTDLGPGAELEALVDYVTETARATTLEKGEVKVSTLEHLMAALYGLGVDNARVSLDGQEVPILDGSARPFTEAIRKDGLQEQSAPRIYLEPKEKIRYKDPVTGSEIIVMPDDRFSVDLMIDYNSPVLGNQYARLDEDTDFATDIAPCRTFVFFHELEPLLKNNLIKGGDLDNAIVIVDRPVPQAELDRLADIFKTEKLERVPEGYLNNLSLRFPNECARHKLLDIIGDFSLVGYPLKAKIIAHKSGHKANTSAVRLLREAAKTILK